MQTNQWTPPYPLRTTQKERIEFPLQALPPPLAEYISAIATNTCTDPAMAATSMLSAVSYTTSGVYRVFGKKDHSEPLVLYSLVISAPGTKKSPIVSLIKEPFDSFLLEYNAKNQTLFFQNNASRTLVLSKIKNAQKTSNCSSQDLATLYEKLKDITNYKERQILVEDITPEMLASKLAYQKSLLILSAESGMLGNFNGRYSSQPNMDLLLKAYSGERYTRNTIKNGDTTIERPYLSIGLMTQPYVWHRLSSCDSFKDSGFLDRLIYCFPSENNKWVYYTEDIPEDLKRNYSKLVYQMLNDKFTMFENNDTSEESIFLDENARLKYKDFCDFIDKEKDLSLAICRSWAGKFHGLVLRLAGIIHVLNCYINSDNPAGKRITFEEMSNAICIGLYYKDQTILAYKIAQESPLIERGEDLINKVKKLGITETGQNELLKHVHCKYYPDAKTLNEVIEYLMDFNCIKREPIVFSNNKTGYHLSFNPFLFN